MNAHAYTELVLWAEFNLPAECRPAGLPCARPEPPEPAVRRRSVLSALLRAPRRAAARPALA